MHFEMKEGLAMAFPYGEEFISPFLMARLRGGAVPGTAAMRGGRLEVDVGGGLPQRLRGEVATGQTISGAFAWQDRDVVFLAAAELAERNDAELRTRQNVEDRQKREHQERVGRETRHAADAERWNAALGIPVDWHINHRIVLSELSRHSNGDGANAATVWHVILEQPFVHARLRRNAGDLLCSKDVGSIGLSAGGDRQGDRSRRVTCRACLRLVERLAGAKAT